MTTAAQPDDAFTLLGLAPGFALEAADLQRAYLERIRAAHPDHAGPTAVPADTDLDTDARSAALNRARQTLEDPESRAVLLHARLGGPSAEIDRSVPPGFLMELMSAREEIEADRAAKRDNWLDRWDAWAEAHRAALRARVAARFTALETIVDAPGRAAALKALRSDLNAWRSIERLGAQLETPDPN
ncbi:hypothetical protein BH11PLA1_BH11PLA1_10040 [soil metagenome]